MEFDRRFIMESDNYVSSAEIRPKGIIIYSSGFPSSRDECFRQFNQPRKRASVHALIDCDGVTQTMPLNHRAWHSRTVKGNSEYLGVMVCEPNPKFPDYSQLRDLTYSNLVQYLVFLCRYWELSPMNECEVIQFAGTASKKRLVAPEVLKPCSHSQPFFHRIVDGGDAGDYACCDERKLQTEVAETLGCLAILYAEIPHVTETSLTQIGIGDVVLFTSGETFTSRGISTCLTFENRMLHGVVCQTAPGSRHPYKVAFPGGPTVWVNKSTLVRSTLGHVSL